LWKKRFKDSENDMWFRVGEHVGKLEKQYFEQEGIKKGKLKIIVRY
jgi:hypothetical protein